jgi:uncharacterized protein YcfJ
MEPRFGRDFSLVRVHTDGDAAESARALSARAFTAGPDVVFATGGYSPGTPAGRNLIAHELAHVVQQASGPVAGTPIADGMSVSHPSDGFELAANAIGNGSLPVHGSKAPLHARDSGEQFTVQRFGVPGEPAKTPPKPSAPKEGKESIMEQPSGQQPTGQQPAAPGTQAPNALSPTPLPYQTWEKIENRISPELAINFLEIGRVATVDVKQQLYDVFSPYDDSIVDANQKWGNYVNIATAFPGNFPNDPSPSSPNTPSPTYSITGGIGGAVNQIGQVAVAKILDTGKVAVAKQRANLDAEALVGDVLTTDSPIFDDFEGNALQEVRGKAELDWMSQQEALPPELLTQPSPATYARYVRREYGPHSGRVKSIITQFQTKLKPYLDKLKARLETLRKLADRQREKAALLGGAIAGGIIGGAIGLGAGGIGGALAGLGIGAVSGAIVGGIGYQLFGKSETPKDETRTDDKRAEDRKNLETIGPNKKEKQEEQEDKEDAARVDKEQGRK